MWRFGFSYVNESRVTSCGTICCRSWRSTRRMYHLLSMGTRLYSFTLPLSMQTKSTIFIPNSLRMAPRGCCSTVSMMQRPVMAAFLKLNSTFHRRPWAESGATESHNKTMKRVRVRMRWGGVIALNFKLFVAHCGVFLHLMQFYAGVVATLFAHLNGCCDKLFAIESDDK